MNGTGGQLGEGWKQQAGRRRSWDLVSMDPLNTAIGRLSTRKAEKVDVVTGDVDMEAGVRRVRSKEVYSDFPKRVRGTQTAGMAIIAPSSVTADHLVGGLASTRR